MKILLLTTLYPEDTRNDLKKDTRAIHYFARQWVCQGHEVVVVHIYFHPIKNIIHYKPNLYNYEITESINEGVRVLLIENQLLWPHARHLSAYQQKKASKRINVFLNTRYPGFKPDVMFVHFPTALRGLVEKIDVSCPRIAILHNTDLVSIKSIKNSKNVQDIFLLYDGIGFRSINIQDKFEQYVKIEKPKFIVNSGIPQKYLPDVETYNAHICRSFSKPLKIIYVGNLIPLKNVDVTIKALKKLSSQIDFNFTIIGDGSEMKALKELTHKLNLQDRIEFTGRLSREESISKLKLSDVFVMVSRPETFGLVYLEAMSQGCIVIGSIGEGIDGVINDKKNGFLVTPNNCDELARKIYDVSIMDNSQREYIVMNSINTVLKMTEENMAINYILSAQNIITKINE